MANKNPWILSTKINSTTDHKKTKNNKKTIGIMGNKNPDTSSEKLGGKEKTIYKRAINEAIEITGK